MARRTTPYPTDGELEILEILWAQGSQTVRDVLMHMRKDRKVVSRNSVQTRLEIMERKGMVRRDDSAPIRSYRAAVAEATTKRNFLKWVADRLFRGSSKEVVMHALSKQTTPHDLEEITARIKALKDPRK